MLLVLHTSDLMIAYIPVAISKHYSINKYLKGHDKSDVQGLHRAMKHQYVIIQNADSGRHMYSIKAFMCDTIRYHAHLLPVAVIEELSTRRSMIDWDPKLSYHSSIIHHFSISNS